MHLDRSLTWRVLGVRAEAAVSDVGVPRVYFDLIVECYFNRGSRRCSNVEVRTPRCGQGRRTAHRHRCALGPARHAQREVGRLGHADCRRVGEWVGARHREHVAIVQG